MDLFDSLTPAPPPKRQDVNTYLAETMPAKPAPIAAPPPPAPPVDRVWPGEPVASFACYCGCQDEVLEPAPEWVTCWGKGCGQQMHRWNPPRLPPSNNARQLTDEERSRI